MSLTKLEQWEKTLREALDGVDVQLEQLYADKLIRRAGRPASGETSSRKYDGLFALNAMFSLGVNTGDGPGYVIDIRTATAGSVSPEMREAIMVDAAALLLPAIAAAFPGRELQVTRFGDRFRLTGDMDL